MGLLGEMFGGGREAHQDFKAESSESNVVSLAEYKAQKGSERIIDECSSELPQMETQHASMHELVQLMEQE